jgi:ATP phosphoribosyltransferase
MIKFALPNKGMLFDPTLDLLGSCGYHVSKAVKALSYVDAANGIEFYFLRPGDIPMYVGQGILDLGITGKDFNDEAGAPAARLMDLHYGASRLCVAAPPRKVRRLSDLKRLRVATSFPHLTRRLLDVRSIVELEGAVEISVSLGLADAVVDIVETGSTLRQAGLEIIGEPLYHSCAALFAHPGREKDARIDTVCKRLEGRLVALNYMMVEYDVPRASLEKACRLTPGLESPTVSPLKHPDWFSVKAMIAKNKAHGVMDQLAAIGCKGILLTRIESARI